MTFKSDIRGTLGVGPHPLSESEFDRRAEARQRLTRAMREYAALGVQGPVITAQATLMDLVEDRQALANRVEAIDVVTEAAVWAEIRGLSQDV